jgi:KDO2-lipid IV(A) lauroyltransferase
MKRLIKAIMVFLMWYPLRWVVGFLPPGFLYALGIFGGRLLHALSGRKRALMHEELSRVFPGRPDAELAAIVREAFINYTNSESEVLLYPKLSHEYIKNYINIEGLHYLDSALREGRGVLLFQAHFGAFQMTMPAIGYSGYTMNQISASAEVWKAEGGHRVEHRMHDIKARYEYLLPVKHIAVSSTMRPVFRALQAGEIVGITVDGGGGRKVVPVSFLGREALFQTGAADLALSTRAVIVPAFILTLPGLRHRLVLHEPIEYDANAGKEACRAEILGKFAALLEGYVRRKPAHYGYTLGLRRSRARIDEYQFFSDYDLEGEKR